MSEKRVNVKITASISEFEKAIEKAQKQIKELTDLLDDINKNKFGDNLEKHDYKELMTMLLSELAKALGYDVDAKNKAEESDEEAGK